MKKQPLKNPLNATRRANMGDVLKSRPHKTHQRRKDRAERKYPRSVTW